MVSVLLQGDFELLIGDIACDHGGDIIRHTAACCQAHPISVGAQKVEPPGHLGIWYPVVSNIGMIHLHPSVAVDIIASGLEDKAIALPFA